MVKGREGRGEMVRGEGRGVMVRGEGRGVMVRRKEEDERGVMVKGSKG